MAVTCVVADDHPAVLEAVVAALQAHGFDVVAQASDGEEAWRAILAAKPAVALVDVRMPLLDGVEVARRAAERAPGTAVVLYTAYAERAVLIDALDAGARGFVLKEAPMNDVIRALEAARAGTVYVDPVLAGVLATAEATERLPKLTQHEREILRLLAGGLQYDEIGRRLYIASETVRTHVRKAMDKLDADTRTQAIATALRKKLIG